MQVDRVCACAAVGLQLQALETVVVRGGCLIMEDRVI